MHVVIVGCGRVGSRLGIELVKMGHSIGIIDKDPSAFRRLPKDWGGIQVVGWGFDRELLETAGAAGAGALAAVTSGDNSNILAARIARETFEIPNVVARIYDPRRAEIYQRLGIPTVATVTWTTDQVLRRIVPDGVAVEWTDPTGSISLVERTLPTAYCGKPISEFERATGARVVVVTRGSVAEIAGDGTIGQEGDILHLVVNHLAYGTVEEFPAVAEVHQVS